MIWTLAHRADKECNALAKEHYTCQSPDSNQFMPPGSCMVLKVSPRLAVWGTSYPKAEFVRHAWAGAWVCSIFRKTKGVGLASEMIREAVAATRWFYGEPPALGMITFIDTSKVEPIRRHGKDVWGYTYIKAGFKHVGHTAGGLMAFQLLLDVVRRADWHHFQLLTKNAPRLLKFKDELPSNLWVGVSMPPTFMFGNRLRDSQQNAMFAKSLDVLAELEDKVLVRYLEAPEVCPLCGNEKLIGSTFGEYDQHVGAECKECGWGGIIA
jgi:hypothetical protein